MIELLHRDGLILVLNKPSGLAVHTGPKVAGYSGKVLTDYLEDFKFGLPQAPALAHRLDRDTSGCILLGRHRKSLDLCGELFKNRLIDKTYLALVKGDVKDDAGVITAPLAKKDASRGWWMKVDEKGEFAETHFKVLKRFDDETLLELKPITGRTHQLRVHCLHIGHPIKGDKVYAGEPRFSENRLMLHAQKIIIPHNLKPKADKKLIIEAPLPPEFLALN